MPIMGVNSVFPRLVISPNPLIAKWASITDRRRHDEVELVVVVREGHDSPIPIAGQYGGSLPLDNGKDIRVTMERPIEEYPILTIYWEKDMKIEVKFRMLFNSYIF